MKSVTALGSVRVDLVGGTLDINPIHLILPDVVTINVATGLKAEVQIEEYSFDGIEIVSKDYNSVYKFSSKDIIKENFDNDFFTEMSFVVQIINYFELTKNIKVSLKSGAPAGSGLGGSSAMGITLFKALCGFTERQFEKVKAFRIVQSIESRILNQGVPGYQDYYPALFGGVLALTPDFDEIKVEQCFTDELKDFLESHLTLVYSGKSRKSGINNWEVYKSFFDGNKETRDGMLEIASISNAAYKAMKSSNFSSLANLIKQEGQAREKLFPNIVSKEIKYLFNFLAKDIKGLGLKMCGAGGGGCFILIHSPEQKDHIIQKIQENSESDLNEAMEILSFEISKPSV